MYRLNLKPVLKGALTFVPGMARLLPEAGGETCSAAYCYGVWLKHLTLLWENGMTTVPKTMAELGPGDSLGTGLAAILSGVDHYRGLDVVEHSSIEANLQVFDELVEMFRMRSPRPIKGWPDFDAYLDTRQFPSHILTEERLRQTLAPERLARIRAVIADPDSSAEDISIRYIAPWFDAGAIQRESVDLIISHAVLGEVVELKETYQALHEWLKPGGWMSHQIGFEFHGINGAWNGYWACPDPLWEIIRGKRPFVLNREPYSTHLELIRNQGFQIVCQLEDMSYSGINRSQLCAPWKNLSDDELNCCGLFIQARK